MYQQVPAQHLFGNSLLQSQRVSIASHQNHGESGLVGKITSWCDDDKEIKKLMTDRDYAIKSMKEITFQMASHAQDYLEVTIERHYTDIKELMTNYQKLILENQMVLEELEMECQEKINEDMAYALSYLSIFNHQLDVAKMHREMNNLMIIYGLSDMIYRGMTLVKFYAPNGVVLSEILHSCFCSHYNKTDVEVQQELGIGRTSFYKMKKQALGYLGFYFYEIVVPQAKDKRFKPSLGVEEE